MTEGRFYFILACLRFDNKITRSDCMMKTNLDVISEIWERFIENYILHYQPSWHITTDEKLIGFRGRCLLKMYVPSKPNKYSIKIVMMCDNTKYMVNTIPYIGKRSNPTKKPVADEFIEKLVV